MCRWIAPKKLSGSYLIVDIAAKIAVCLFNEGNYALLKFLDDLGIDLGPSSHQWDTEADALRVKRADQHTAALVKRGQDSSENGKKPTNLRGNC